MNFSFPVCWGVGAGGAGSGESILWDPGIPLLNDLKWQSRIGHSEVSSLGTFFQSLYCGCSRTCICNRPSPVSITAAMTKQTLPYAETRTSITITTTNGCISLYPTVPSRAPTHRISICTRSSRRIPYAYAVHKVLTQIPSFQAVPPSYT